jgi:hypothetical protein
MESKIIHLEGYYVIKAPREAIYNVITDFENAPKYFPRVAKSAKCISRDGNNFIFEIETKAFWGSMTFKVRMEGQLRPPEGFLSTNTSLLGIEREGLMLCEVPEGTGVHYINDVEITSPFFRRFHFLIKEVALRYWERAVFEKLRLMFEKK